MKLTLIRHTAVDVPPGTCYGQTDVPLKEGFEQEASRTKEALRGLAFNKIYTSPLSRCVRLASYCGYPEAQRDPRLLELNFGAWEMQRFEEIRDPRLQLWYADYLHVPATGGESFAMQYERVSEFLSELRQHPIARAALFVHGGVIACAQVYTGLVDAAHAFEQLTPYGGVVEVEL